MAEWSVHWTRNAAVLGSSPTRATCWIFSSHPEFKFSATLVNSQLAGCLLPVGVLNPVML